MLMPLADILDRCSICFLKKNLGKVNVDEELIALEQAAVKYSSDVFTIASDGTEVPSMNYRIRDWILRLTMYNALIWSLESDIRSGKEGLLGLEEIGRRALKIRDYNAHRVEIKKEIAAAVGEYVEIKTDHASA